MLDIHKFWELPKLRQKSLWNDMKKNNIHVKQIVWPGTPLKMETNSVKQQRANMFGAKIFSSICRRHGKKKRIRKKLPHIFLTTGRMFHIEE